ncbi:hypothetical protein A6R68_21869, partial [Neotoma lepida]
MAILRIQSGEGRRKAFSTCSSHLCVVGLFFGSAIVMYMAPKAQHPETQQKILSLFYSLFNPMLNPLIYSLRNAEVKGAVKRVFLFNPMLNPLIYSLRNAEVKGALKRILWKGR